MLLQMKILIDVGEYKDALEIVNEFQRRADFGGSHLYLQYYKAYCEYNVGNEDDAYTLTLELIKQLKATSARNANEQPIYCLVYSFMATLQNHLMVADGGLHYYTLALNHARNHLANKKFYYDILRKSDMFFVYPVLKESQLECIRYYNDHSMNIEAGQVYLNLGTEIMFQETGMGEIVRNYLMKATSIFSSYPNEHLAYAKNNLALYYAIEENNIPKALEMLEEASLVGLSEFSNMTLTLNQCSCLLLLNNLHSIEFQRIYSRFLEYVRILKARKYPSRYEAIYQTILELLILEREGETSDILKRCKQLQINGPLDDFFRGIIADIEARNERNEGIVHLSNRNVLHFFNQKRIFFAEFRFWE